MYQILNYIKHFILYYNIHICILHYLTELITHHIDFNYIDKDN